MAVDRMFRLLFTAEDQSARGVDSFRTRIKSIRDELAAARNTLLALAGAQLGITSLQALVQAADDYQDLSARVRQFTRDGDEAVAMQKAIYETAQNAALPLATSADLYQALHARVVELGGGLMETSGIANVLATAIDRSGTSAADGEALISGLAKSLAAGEFNGKSFNALLAATPQLLEILAKQLGLTTAQLREMGASGEIDGKTLLNALIAVRGEVDQLADAGDSVGEGMQRVGNSLVQALGEADARLGATDLAARALTGTAEHLGSALEAVGRLLIVGAAFAAKQALLVTGTLTAEYLKQMVVSRGLLAEHVARQRALVAETQATVAALTQEIRLAQSYIAAADAALAAAASERVLIPLRNQHAAATARLAAAQAGLTASLASSQAKILTWGNTFNLALAAVAGWQLGAWLKNEFVVVEKAGIALAAGVHQTLVRLQFAFKRLVDIGGSERERYLREESAQLAEIRDSYGVLFDQAGVPAPAPAAPAIAPLTGDLPGTGDDKEEADRKAAEAARKAAAARERLRKAEQDAALALTKAGLDREKALLDAQFEQQLISQQHHQAESLRLVQAGIDAEIAAREAQLKDADAAEAARLNGEIAVLRLQRIGAAEDSANKEVQIRRRAAEEMASLDQRLLEASGRVTEARLAGLQAEFDRLVARLTANADSAGVALAQRLFNVERTKIQLDALVEKAAKIGEAVSTAEQRAANQVQSGAATSAEVDAPLREARQQAITQLMSLRDQLDALARQEVPGAAEALHALDSQVAQLARGNLTGLGRAIAGLREQLDQMQRDFAQSATNAGVDALSDFFQDATDGAGSVGDAFKGLARNFAASMAQIAARALATIAVLNLLRAIPGGAAAIAALDVGATTLHTGGIAGVHGTPRSLPAVTFAAAPRYHEGGIAGLRPNEVPAVLEFGEEVLRRDDPRHRSNLGNGGGTRVINVVDKSLVEDFMASSSGEQVLVNVIRRNAGSIRQVLG